MFLKNTLILRPQKLIQLIKRVVYHDQVDLDNEDGIMDERTFENLCQPFIEQKQSILALLKKFDLLCEKLSSSSNAAICKQYYVPGSIRRTTGEKSIIEKDEQSIVFYYLFDGYFPGRSSTALLLFRHLIIVALNASRESLPSDPRSNNQMDSNSNNTVT